MTAALLFAATFAAVCTLGLQQINVERRWIVAAALTSPAIGAAHLVLFKVLPGPTSVVEIFAYLAGGSAGIAASIWAHPRLAALIGSRSRAASAALAAELRQAQAPAAGNPLATPDAVQVHALRLGESLRLATQIADDAARADIETNCAFERIGNHTWYDVESTEVLHGPEFAEMVATGVRYLRLRGHIVNHPTQGNLVRIEQ